MPSVSVKPTVALIVIVGAPCAEAWKVFRHHGNATTVELPYRAQDEETVVVELVHVVDPSSTLALENHHTSALRCIVLYAFSAAHPESMRQITEVWTPWVARNVRIEQPKESALLVTRVDLVGHTSVMGAWGVSPVTFLDTVGVCASVNAKAVVVTSVRLGEGILELSDALAALAVGEGPSLDLCHVEKRWEDLTVLGKRSYETKGMYLATLEASPLVMHLHRTVEQLTTEVTLLEAEAISTRQQMVAATMSRQECIVQEEEMTRKAMVDFEEAERDGHIARPWCLISLRDYASRILDSVPMACASTLLSSHEALDHAEVGAQHAELLSTLSSISLERQHVNAELGLATACGEDSFRHLADYDAAIDTFLQQIADLETEQRDAKRRLREANGVVDATHAGMFSGLDLEITLVRAIHRVDERVFVTLQEVHKAARDLEDCAAAHRELAQRQSQLRQYKASIRKVLLGHNISIKMVEEEAAAVYKEAMMYDAKVGQLLAKWRS